jgi:hypothetical protein
MTTWHTKNLGDPLLASDSLEEIKRLFSLMFGDDGYSDENKHPDAVIFVRNESEGRLHCEVIVYFSPGTVNLAKSLGATACIQPSPHDLSVLAGSIEATLKYLP